MNDYVLNSASLTQPYSDATTARLHLAALLRGLALLDSDADVLPSLRLNIDPWLQPLVQEHSAPPITLGELAHSFYGTVDHDLAAFFDSLSRSVPSDHALDEVSIDAILRLVPDGPAPGYEQTFVSVQASGIDGIICAVMDFILVGLLRCDLWRFDRLGFVSGPETFEFDHVAEASHAEAIRGRRITALRSTLTARSFWTRRARVFPGLLFGLDVEDQIGRFSATLLPLLFKRLAELDARARTWRASAMDQFPDGQTEIREETPRTMMRYGTQRNFRGHDGVTRTFEEHMWIDRTHRMHVFRDVIRKTVEIGYVGRHLATMENPT